MMSTEQDFLLKLAVFNEISPLFLDEQLGSNRVLFQTRWSHPTSNGGFVVEYTRIPDVLKKPQDFPLMADRKHMLVELHVHAPYGQPTWEFEAKFDINLANPNWDVAIAFVDFCLAQVRG